MRSELLYLQDITEAITAIEKFLDGIEKKKFLANDMLQSAVLYKVIIIGEATAKISDEIKQLYPQTSWKKSSDCEISQLTLIFRLIGKRFGQPFRIS